MACCKKPRGQEGLETVVLISGGPPGGSVSRRITHPSLSFSSHSYHQFTSLTDGHSVFLAQEGVRRQPVERGGKRTWKADVSGAGSVPNQEGPHDGHRDAAVPHLPHRAVATQTGGRAALRHGHRAAAARPGDARHPAAAPGLRLGRPGRRWGQRQLPGAGRHRRSVAPARHLLSARRHATDPHGPALAGGARRCRVRRGPHRPLGAALGTLRGRSHPQCERPRPF